MRPDWFCELFIHPNKVNRLTYHEQGELIRCLRRTQLIGQFAQCVKLQQNIDSVPKKLATHLDNALKFANAQSTQVISVATKLQNTLSEQGLSCMFLKGAAYCVARTQNGKGRTLSDIDILVEHVQLDLVEKTLVEQGWRAKRLDDYDEKYYREWSHELPPFTHPETGVTLDIHHTFIPPISGIEIDIKTVWKTASSTTHQEKYALLTPSLEYLILHSAVHLLINDDVNKGIRDLYDLKILVDEQRLTDTHLNNLHSVFANNGLDYEFHLLLALLHKVWTAENAQVSTARNLKDLNTRFISKALFPQCPYFDIKGHGLAHLYTYSRGHLKKMPLPIFLKHTIYKTYKATIKALFGDFVFKR